MHSIVCVLVIWPSDAQKEDGSHARDRKRSFNPLGFRVERETAARGPACGPRINVDGFEQTCDRFEQMCGIWMRMEVQDELREGTDTETQTQTEGP